MRDEFDDAFDSMDDEAAPAPSAPTPSGRFTAAPPPASAPPPWEGSLNDAQSQAVTQLDGAILVLAGAGTGKTKVLTTRLAELIYHKKAQPYEILCVTFTNKAAKEMRHRVEALIGDAARDIWLGTFHSIGVKILRKHADLVGLGSDLTILDSDDQNRLIKRIIEEDSVNIDTKRFPPRLISHFIQRWKDRGESPEDIRFDSAGGDGIPYDKISQIYTSYQARLQQLNAADFGDLLLYNLKIMKQNHDVLEMYQEKFKYILVDEYQDTNTAQYLWLRLLAQKRQNICCVGDDDQSIYGWRGAEIGNILKFTKDFPNALTVRLERNYRSTSHILSAASGLIAKNNERLGKTLWTQGNQGEKIKVVGHWDHSKEARYAANEIANIKSKGGSLGQVAVLVRAGFMTRAFEEQLLKFGIAYKVIGGAKFYEREEIRDAIAYLRLMANPSDNLAFERIVNKPARGIGDTLLNHVIAYAKSYGGGYFHAAEKLSVSDEIKAVQANKLEAFVNLISKKQRHVQLQVEVSEEDFPPHVLAQQILQDSGYLQMWQKKIHSDPQAEGRLENINELFLALQEFDSVGQFLEHVALVTDQDSIEDNNAVSLMTLHASKGLEFDYVFLPGWEEGLFPNQRSMDEGGNKGVEEERRLAYVGITRAKSNVWISYANSRFVHGNWVNSLPSRFLDELPVDDLLIMTSDDNGVAEVMHRAPEERAVYKKPVNAVEFNSGDTCRHKKFGQGVVLEGGDGIIRVEFVGGVEKSISALYLELVNAVE